MQELFFTILTIWVLFRLFTGTRVQYNYTAHHHHHQSQKKESEVKIEPRSEPKKTGFDKVGEYVEFEEIK